MKNLTLPMLALLASQATYAGGFLDSLREVRGTLGEVTGTAREADRLGKEVGINQGGNTKSQKSDNRELQPGDVLQGKISNLSVYTESRKDAPVLMRVSKSEEMIYMGEESAGLLRVTTTKGEGWVEKILVKQN